MNFRVKPKAETYEQIYASEPWYDIAKNDVFPEDFRRWMIGREDLKEHFLNYHKNLFDPLHWQKIQKRIKAVNSFMHSPTRRKSALDLMKESDRKTSFSHSE